MPRKQLTAVCCFALIMAVISATASARAETARPAQLAAAQGATQADSTAKPPDAATRLKIEPDELPAIQRDLEKLPGPVRTMHRLILDAARSGEIERFTEILKANKVPLAVSIGGDDDPVGYWKKLSQDGAGREILADIVRVFEAGFVHVGKGTDHELFVWPYHYVYPLEKLTPAQEVELYMLIPAEYRDAMQELGGYTGFRGGLSPDGTWHFFIAGE